MKTIFLITIFFLSLTTSAETTFTEVKGLVKTASYNSMDKNLENSCVLIIAQGEKLVVIAEDRYDCFYTMKYRNKINQFVKIKIPKPLIIQDKKWLEQLRKVHTTAKFLLLEAQ